ncbi:MAG: TlpA family protein disulfide reductase [Acidimicrobiia bacterium]
MSTSRQQQRHAPPKRSNSTTWIWIAVGAVVVVLGVGAIVLSRNSSPASAKEIGSTVKVTGTELPLSPEATKDNPNPPDPAIGMTAPKVTGVAPNGKAVTLGPDGKPTLLLLVTHWCPHCQAEIPRIKEYQDEGLFNGVEVQVLSTAQNDARTNWPPSSWLSSKGPEAVVLSDDADGGAAKAYGLRGFPTIIAIDKDGKVVARTSGEQTKAQVQKLLNAARTGQPLATESSGASSAAK